MSSTTYACLKDPNRVCKGLRIASHIHLVDGPSHVMVDCDEDGCDVKSPSARRRQSEGDQNTYLLVPCSYLKMLEERLRNLETREDRRDALDREEAAAWLGSMAGRGPIGG